MYSELDSYMVPSSWINVLAGTQGEIKKAGTLRIELVSLYIPGRHITHRTPRRSKLKVTLKPSDSPSKEILSSGIGTFMGGATWSANPPCSSKFRIIRLYVKCISNQSLMLISTMILPNDLHVVPILGVTDSVVQVLDHCRTSSNVGSRVHRGNGAAFRVDVRELW